MHGHDIIVIGASAGGVEALQVLARGLPEDLAAAVFVVLHISPQTPSILPSILARAGALPAAHAADGQPIEHGRIYVAPSDHHLLVEPGQVRVVRGPKENRYRPAVDPLFRSAALAYGPRVVGVILTGALDDGAAGIRYVKQRGGVTVVQDPAEALYPGMPRSAARSTRVDYQLPLDRIAPLLARLAREEAADDREVPVPEDLKTEAEIAKQKLDAIEMLRHVERLGKLTPFTCPECHGTLWEMQDGELLRFRCHVGHALTAESLVSEQSEVLENALWSALRALEEKVTLTRRMAERARGRNYDRAAKSFDLKAAEGSRHAEVVRDLLLNGREHSAVGGTDEAESDDGLRPATTFAD
ncbi:MAG TPA: chemotaxis protein CheB [Pyrinomonadaceae bacterium]|nr:chemotaxis protein CheB [Pyrinomonadaceae bacterium]